jgi:diguanylate cyclase (GGDEF)-like protein/PAS domain S-box-containing protein
MSESRSSDTWFDMSNDLACEASLDGYFTRLNKSWELCLGFSIAELMARPYVELIHPDDVEPTVAAAGSLAAGPSEVVNFENRYAHKDGGWRWLLWSARSDGEKIYAVAKDISERKRLESEREELLARVEAMARTDELTGLANRRALDEELRRELSRAKRSGDRLTVAMLDIDRFKAYNDRHGHPAGDELLREAAGAWRLALRETDFIARYGGEEFVVLLPACPPDDAPAILQRLRATTPAGQTVSGGVAVWNGSESAESLLARADRALYAAKRAGRDRLLAASQG